MNTTDLDLTPNRKDRLADLAKLKAWQILLGIFFVFALLLPSLAAPPSLQTVWTVLCSVLVYRWWVTRATARTLLVAASTGASCRAVCFRSIWSVAWRSFLLFVFLPCLLALLIATSGAFFGAAIAVSLMTWFASLLFSADAAWGVVRRVNPSASTSAIFGVSAGLFVAAGIFFAVPALVAGLAARKQLKAPSNEEKGLKLAWVGIGFAVAVLAINIVLLSYFALTGTSSTSAKSDAASSSTGSATAPIGPPPSGTAADLHERFKAYGERTGDPRVAEVMETHFSIIKRLEDRSRDMIAAHNQLDPDAIFDPQAAGAGTIAQQLQVLDTMQNAALAYKDAALLFRETLTAEMSKTHSENPQFVAESMDKSQPGMILALQWSDTALAFSGAGRRFLQSFQDTGEADAGLLQALAGRAEEYDAALDRMQQRIENNQAIIQEHLPR